jgi:hypothetical protein
MSRQATSYRLDPDRLRQAFEEYREAVLRDDALGMMNDGATELSEASFAEDWDSAEDRVYDPTTGEERERWYESIATEGILETWNREGHWIGRDVLRLITQVEALEAENERLHYELTGVNRIAAKMKEEADIAQQRRRTEDIT